LDLRGGMNVILEVDKSAIISGMANDKENPQLVEALGFATKRLEKKEEILLIYLLLIIKA